MNDPTLLNRAKDLRKTMTEAEKKLWFFLRAHRFRGAKFRRQQPIGSYIVDFASFRHRLIIELDGSQHLAAQAYDQRRDAFLKKEGFTVLRFWNDQIWRETQTVLHVIWQALAPSEKAPDP